VETAKKKWKQEERDGSDLTCELGEQAPAAMAVGLDVVDEELVLLRRPGPLLEALGPVAARRPPHRPPPAESLGALALALALTNSHNTHSCAH
jgi:hypothetical protein